MEKEMITNMKFGEKTDLDMQQKFEKNLMA